MNGVPEEPELRVNRLERRKQRTRAALVKAAQALIAEGRLNVPVLEITQAADVGMGSFYNHFDSKEQLFEVAVADVLDTHGAVLDRLTADLDSDQLPRLDRRPQREDLPDLSAQRERQVHDDRRLEVGHRHREREHDGGGGAERELAAHAGHASTRAGRDAHAGCRPSAT